MMEPCGTAGSGPRAEGGPALGLAAGVGAGAGFGARSAILYFAIESAIVAVLPVLFPGTGASPPVSSAYLALMLLAYASYYNPLNLARTLLRPANTLYLAGLSNQVMGMIGLVPTAINSLKWSFRLRRGPVTRTSRPPGPKTPLIDVSPTQRGSVDATRPAARKPELVRLGVA